MDINQMKEIAYAVSSALSFLYQDCEAICDDDYRKEVTEIICELEKAENTLNIEIDKLS